jgi:hypothetical protein
MADFDQIFNDIKNQLGPLAQQDLQQFAGQGKQDAEAFLEQSRANLAMWTAQLAKQEITQDEFTFNVESQKAAAEMTALQATNAGQVRIDQFRNSVFNVVIQTAVAAVAKQV